MTKIARGYRTEGDIPKKSGIYLGLVRKNFDGQRMGRLMVWVSDFGPDVEENWIAVSYASPFAGATNVAENRKGGDSERDSQKSYGFWATPPDVDNQVLCCFLDGDIANGYWFACIYPQNMNHMIPAIASHSPSKDDEMDEAFAPYGPPTVEYNKKSDDNMSPTSNPANRESVTRPVFTPLAESLIKQGLTQDQQRGPSNTSARRESPSRVYGMLSPRGNSIHIDDGPLEGQNEFIRFRTRSGVQVLLHETEGYIYMITKDGNSWVEISDGGIDMYSANSISLNSDKDVNINAGGKIGLQGIEGVHIAAKQFTAYTAGPFEVASGANLSFFSQAETEFLSNLDFNIATGGDISFNSGKNIISGACGIISRNGTVILDNSGGPSPEDVTPPENILEDVLSRRPTHEPFPHNGTSGPPVTGVDRNGNPTTEVIHSDGSVTQEPVPVPREVAERAKVIYRLLKAKGYNDIQIAGILGTFQQESSLNPNAINSIGARGLAQWLGSRRKLLENAARAAGANVNNVSFQIDFFHTDKEGPDGGGAGKKLRQSKSVKDAVTAMNYYERFGGFRRTDPWQNATGGHEVGQRYQYAENHYAAIKQGKYS